MSGGQCYVKECHGSYPQADCPLNRYLFFSVYVGMAVQARALTVFAVGRPATSNLHTASCRLVNGFNSRSLGEHEPTVEAVQTLWR